MSVIKRFIKPKRDVSEPLDVPMLNFYRFIIPGIAIREVTIGTQVRKVGFMKPGRGDIGSGKVAAYGPNGIVEEPFEKGNIDDAVRAVCSD